MSEKNKEYYRVVNARETNKKRFGNKGYLYLINIVNSDLYKIGVSQALRRRLRDISSHLPYEINVLMTIELESAYDFEKMVHYEFKENYLKSEWFIFDKDKLKEIIKKIKQVCQQEDQAYLTAIQLNLFAN